MLIERTFGALSDQHRLKMVLLLGERPCTVDELRKKTGISQSSTSQHLKVLSEAGLVNCSKHGNFRIYSLRQGELKKAMQFFDRLWDEGLSNLKSRLENEEQ